MKRKAFVRILLSCTAAAFVPAGAALAQNVNIGLASAARNQVIVVGEVNRGLKTGDAIFQNQQIRTGPNSAAQLLFRDETALTMGPSASLVLDKAIYDPDKRAGEITVRAVSGAFRFVSGSSPVGSYSINTPAGTVGIRGTWIEMLIAGETIRLIVRRGVIRFCNAAGTCATVVAGYEIRGSSRHVGLPTKVSPETVESIVALWFGENSEANLGELAPGAGGENDQASTHSKSFWWLDGNYKGYNTYDQGGFTNTGLPGSGPPGSGPPGSGPPGSGPPGSGPPGSGPPGSGPPGSGPPGSGPPINRPPTTVGFPPISNPGVGIPPGLANKSTLPPGLANRGPDFLPPGQVKKN